LPPDLQFMVHSSEVIDEEGYAHRGSKVTLVQKGAEPPQWRVRDFAFAAYSGKNVSGLREVSFGSRSVWAFSSAREHCEELIVFRKATDTRRRWNEDAMMENPTVKDMFFMMRAEDVTSETPLFKQFNGEWGFWESFFVPVLDQQQTMHSLSLMDPGMCEDYFDVQGMPVACFNRERAGILTIPEELSVRYTEKIAVKEMAQWTEMLGHLGDDMVMTGPSIVEHKHLKAGDLCIECYREVDGIEEHARLIRRDLEQLKVPVIITFECNLRPATEWDPDMIALKHKIDSMGQVYSSNLLGGFSSLSGAKADPWHPIARLAVNALNKIMARFPDIRTVLDVGCGDMSWIHFWLQEQPMLSYVGADIMSHCLAVNVRRFPRLSFIQTDLSNLTGIEVLPQGCDLLIAKDVFNHMPLPDAINAMKRVLGTRPRFLLTHIHGAADNTGWEKRIDKHLHYTRWDYNKPPFSLPFPVSKVQDISDEACFVLYEIMPEDAAMQAASAIERLRLPEVKVLEAFSTVGTGALCQPPAMQETTAAAAATVPTVGVQAAPSPAQMGGEPAFRPPERTKLTMPVTELPDQEEKAKMVAGRKPIKGMPPVEFRACCDLIFDAYDREKRGTLKFNEVAALMESGGRKIETPEAYDSLCGRMSVDPAAGLGRKDVYRLMEKSPLTLWEELNRQVNPHTQMVRKGADTLPEAFLEKSLAEFLFEENDQFAMVHVELNAHMYYGASEAVSLEEHVQAWFGEKRMELCIHAPGAFGSKELYTWKLLVAPLAGDVIPTDCLVELKETTGRFGSKKLTIKLMKSGKRRWYKVGQVTSGPKP